MISIDESLEDVLSRHGHDPHALLQILREVQEQSGWLPKPLLSDVARALN